MVKPLGKMETRSAMQCVSTQKYGVTKGYEHCFRVDLDDDRYYIGMEGGVEDDSVMTWYYMPTGDSEALVFVCMGDSDPYDRFTGQINDKIMPLLKDRLPLLMRALHNGRNDNYSSPALIKLDSPNGSKCVCLSMKLDGFNCLLPWNWTSQEAVGKVFELVEYTGNIADELQQNGMSDVGGLATFVRRLKNVQHDNSPATIAKNAWRIFKALNGLDGSSEE